MTRALIFGSRDAKDQATVWTVLDAISIAIGGITVVIEGGQTGIDTFAGEWADARGIVRRTFEANWKLRGDAAGPFRNARMISEGAPDIGIMFPGGRGTADMRAKLDAAGIECCEVRRFKRKRD